jgi:small subunit ribosomal protein S17
MKTAEQKTKIAQKVLSGRVVSTGANKTIRVVVERQVAHPLYKKQMRRSTTYAVHAEASDIKVGDIVHFVQTRPISKTKFYTVVQK